jgi:hypothetical protein
MGATAKVLYTPEEIAKMEIRNFVNTGLKDVQNNDLYDFDKVLMNWKTGINVLMYEVVLTGKAYDRIGRTINGSHFIRTGVN